MSPSPRPRLTVGLPVYNGERYLAQTLQSLLQQDYDDFQLVVSDNASTDDTRRIVERFAARDARLRLVVNDRNMGAAYNYNRLVADARSELFKWAGYDDLLDPGHLRACVEALDEQPDAVIAYPETTVIDGEGERVAPYTDRLEITDHRPWRRVAALAWQVSLCNACFGVMRRETMLRTGLIRSYTSSDVTFLAEMAAHGTFVRIPENLFYRRVHSGSSRQGDATADEVSAWFDPRAVRAPRAPRAKLVVETAAALNDGPAPFRSSAAFVSTYVARRLHIRASHTKSAVLRRTPAGRLAPLRESAGSS